MKIVFVYVHVKDEYIEDFKQATFVNAKNSINEEGIERFDFFQQNDEPDKFLLIEVYKNDEAPAKHKQTQHYLKWRETVENMMEEPRKGVTYQNIFAGDKMWGVP